MCRTLSIERVLVLVVFGVPPTGSFQDRAATVCREPLHDRRRDVPVPRARPVADALGLPRVSIRQYLPEQLIRIPRSHVLRPRRVDLGLTWVPPVRCAMVHRALETPRRRRR